jgi:hypothetical protein
VTAIGDDQGVQNRHERSILRALPAFGVPKTDFESLWDVLGNGTDAGAGQAVVRSLMSTRSILKGTTALTA